MPAPPLPLFGATWDAGRLTVRIPAAGVGHDALELLLPDAAHPMARVDGVFQAAVPGVGIGTRYALRVPGTALALLDPWARAVELEEDRAVGVAVPTPALAPDDRPRVPWADTVVYEAHVRGLTAGHPRVEPALRGTYLGLASEPVLAHLRGLGVTTVELLPIHAFLSEPHLRRRGLTNYWGYTTVAFLAPHPAYATDGRATTAVAECTEMVRRLHAAGIEVLLDVVYNHTAEGDETGPTLSLRGLDDATWYRHEPDGSYTDFTGCGATLDIRRPVARRLVLDSLRHWAGVIGVDGFRFDLAPALGRDPDGFDADAPLFRAIREDPLLADRKLVAEPWDLGPDGYRLGGFTTGWVEWNDQFRDDVRDWWRRAGHGPGRLAQRLAGSADVFGQRAPLASLNFVTAHDGFTLADLVSYARKHNEANGEQGADGRDDNRSDNHGVEGPTDNVAVRAIRARQQRNLLGTLLLAHGVPMLLAGDERGRTQQGNNNAYCHDGPLTWVDWSVDPQATVLTAFVRRCLALRRAHPILRTGRPLTGLPLGDDDLPDALWLDGAGGEMAAAGWHEPSRLTLGLYLHAGGPGVDGLVVWLHAGRDPVEVVLPAALAGAVGEPLLDTTSPDGAPTAVATGPTVVLTGRSLLVARLSDESSDDLHLTRRTTRPPSEATGRG